MSEQQTVKLDLGCGRNKREGFMGVDILSFPEVDLVFDLRQPNWPIDSDSVDEINCSHFLEHLTGAERINFFNEVYRILKPGAQATIVTPNWSHERAYGDPTHQWPPVSAWTYYYLDKNWRDVNAPHVGYQCHFEYSIAGTHDPNDQLVAFRTYETKAMMMSRYVNTTTDIIATIIKREMPQPAA